MAQSESATKEQLPELVERFAAWASLVDLAGYYGVDAETISGSALKWGSPPVADRPPTVSSVRTAPLTV
jgi:hypothetical protein